ncbi:DNA methyltransferase [uncultured Thiocystis sp.]|jgi:DNA modification methylase/transcriptional regulator with XRE-family HTH domain|uniref:DNA methyltransferase n=1 Tax=uncultured Thiocystis sp. TaxID=1202134 RepID=UPI0025F9C6DE|nr:DNA methyltransferase [uncultured Thiocystis sp.]
MPEITITEQLKEIRAQTGLSYQELAQLLGTSLVAVDHWERNISDPSFSQKENIAKVLSDIKKNQGIRIPEVVLQNGSFASRGSTRAAMRLHQPDLFTTESRIRFNLSPLQPILARLKSGIFFDQGESTLETMLDRHAIPASTPDQATIMNISAGKNTYTYDAHTYHTKVPPQGILAFLRHYLPEDGLVLDPFAGSGMTGVAARIAGMDVILNELSPAACFIARNFTTSVSPEDFSSSIKEVMRAVADVRNRLYSTTCRECGKETEILYTVWSYRVLCTHCQSEFVLWNHCRQYGKTVREHKILKEFPCPNCNKKIKKRELSRSSVEPVLIGYKCCSKHQIEHALSHEDIKKIEDINSGDFLAEHFYPTNKIPEGVNLNQPRHHGLLAIDQLYTKRNLSAMSQLWKAIHRIENNDLAAAAAFVFTSLYQRVTRMSEFRFWGGSGNTARFNVPFIFNEANVFVTFERKAGNILDHLETTAVHYKGTQAVICQSATNLDYLPDNSIDLIFTDPPFGANINYSEMNILWESWLGNFTDTTHEAIINRAQGKNIQDYQDLMCQSLSECFRVLRPGHWMLLVFMNSSGQVWAALKSAIEKSGFIIKKMDIFDKQHGTFKHFVSDNTAGCDLVLHCQKPFNAKQSEDREEISNSSVTIADFLAGRDRAIPITNYLHVVRSDELDWRRLYSEWLVFSMQKNHEQISFIEFKDAAMRFLAALQNIVKNSE